jgi:uncharacterized protein (TIGR03089 family)
MTVEIDAGALLAGALRSDPGRPLLTMYDDATGERIELSVTTFANWVFKTANLLVDELMLEPGEAVSLDLPAHWQPAVIQVAVLIAGGQLTREPARITFWLEGTDLPADRVIEEIVGLALRPMGMGLVSTPAGVMDYSVDVRGHGDHYSPRNPPTLINVEPLTERVLCERLDALLPALLGGGSLVLCRHTDASKLAHRAETERVTATIDLEVEGLPRLG